MPPPPPAGPTRHRLDTGGAHVSGVCFDRPLQPSKQLHTHSSATLAGPKVHRRLFFFSRHPERCLTYRNGSRTPQLFILTSTVVRKCYLSAERLLLAPPTPLPPSSSSPLLHQQHLSKSPERQNAPLCPQVSQIYGFMPSMRRASFYPPLVLLRCLSPFQPSNPLPPSTRFLRHLAPTSGGLSGGREGIRSDLC